MGRNCARALENGPSPPRGRVNNRFIFLLKTIKLQAMRLSHFNFLLKSF